MHESVGRADAVRIQDLYWYHCFSHRDLTVRAGEASHNQVGEPLLTGGGRAACLGMSSMRKGGSSEISYLPVFLKAKGKDRTPAPIAELHKVATEGNAALWMGASWLVSATSWRSSSGVGGPVKADMMILARCPVEVSTSRTSSSSRGFSNLDILVRLCQTKSEDKGR